MLLLKTVPEQSAGSSCTNGYLIEHSREAQMSNTTNNSVETILMQLFYWFFPSRQQLDFHIRLMCTYRKKSQEEERWKQRLWHVLQECNRQYKSCREKNKGHLITIASQATTIAEQDEALAASVVTIASKEKDLNRCNQEIATLSTSFTKVYQNGLKEGEEFRRQKEELRMTIARQEETIKNQAEHIKWLWRRVSILEPGGFR